MRCLSLLGEVALRSNDGEGKPVSRLESSFIQPLLEAGHGTLGHGHVTQALVTGAALGRQWGQDAHIRAHGLEMLVLGGQILDKRAAHGIHRRR